MFGWLWGINQNFVNLNFYSETKIFVNKLISRSFILYFLVISFWSCGGKKTHENEIVVFCAASLSPVMEKIKVKWEDGHQEKIIINAASSGILARQIENGAQADIFLSANLDWMDYLIKTTSIKNVPKSVASNRLAIVIPFDAELDSIGFKKLILVLLNQKGKISMGDPGHVPLGKYTKESMDFYNMYNELSFGLIKTKDARNTLMLVELGEAAFGFVYLSDALTSKKIRIVAVIPKESHQAIDYQAIHINDENPGTKAFFEYISSLETKGIWAGMGFMEE